MISMPTVRPDGTARRSWLASVAFDTACRFTCKITSPAWSDRAAGLSWSTSVMTAPLVPDGRSIRRATSGVTLFSVIPRALRVTVGTGNQNADFVETLRSVLADA